MAGDYPAENRELREPGDIDLAWTIVENIDPDAYLKKFDSMLEVLQREEGKVAPHSDVRHPAWALARVMQHTVGTPFEKRADHGMLRMFRERYELIFLVRSVIREMEQSEKSNEKLGYEDIRERWTRD
jgi:hypothetical protein